MPEGVSYEDLKQRRDKVYGAFEQLFERFLPFVDDRHDINSTSQLMADLRDRGITLEEAENTLRELLELRTQFIGKKGEWAALKKMIGRVEDGNERAEANQIISLREVVMSAHFGDAEITLRNLISELRVERERVDVTLPGRRPRHGHLHPITILRQKIEDIFVSLGYAIEDDREIETDFYNFTALNIPENHPARDPLDTFYTTEGFALRSQTSTVQIHAMERRSAPLRMIAPGRVFRRDTPDATHNPMFYQVEGLCVDRGITMAHLKGTLTEFVHRLVGPETRTRFRPSYFPFTEPSAEVDYSCFKCNGTGCRICKQSGWIELGGSGMVHPNVLRAVQIDPEEFSGFAFGFGIDRMSALMYKLDDIRLLFENDVRFLEQFN
ncbi:MAG: phenylalanyl-tRNA synthetase alpha chain [Acidobacteriota bacterium]|jgi:phenylalanyl-tRNA synthetase alpha chain|nr:phenylalanyl-tRNA synthetase alpha chain [Acidobacteriota bacterium]